MLNTLASSVVLFSNKRVHKRIRFNDDDKMQWPEMSNGNIVLGLLLLMRFKIAYKYGDEDIFLVTIV